MNIPFKLSYSATGLKQPLLLADNEILAALDTWPTGSGHLLANWNVRLPTAPFYLTGIYVTANAACEFELGVYDGVTAGTFVPVFSTYATENAVGGIMHDIGDSLYVPHLDTNAWKFAARVTPASGAVKVSGEIRVFPKG